MKKSELLQLIKKESIGVKTEHEKLEIQCSCIQKFVDSKGITDFEEQNNIVLGIIDEIASEMRLSLDSL